MGITYQVLGTRYYARVTGSKLLGTEYKPLGTTYNCTYVHTHILYVLYILYVGHILCILHILYILDVPTVLIYQT